MINPNLICQSLKAAWVKRILHGLEKKGQYLREYQTIYKITSYSICAFVILK